MRHIDGELEWEGSVNQSKEGAAAAHEDRLGSELRIPVYDLANTCASCDGIIFFKYYTSF